MVGIVKALLGALLASFKPWTGLVLENLALRHQLTALRRTRPRRIRLCAVDRLLFVWLYRLWPGVLEAMAIVRPEIWSVPFGRTQLAYATALFCSSALLARSAVPNSLPSMSLILSFDLRGFV